MCWRSDTIADLETGRTILHSERIIDVHAHLFVPEVEKLIEDEPGAKGARDQTLAMLGLASAEYNSSMFSGLLPRLTDPAVRLADMDRMGVAAQLVSPSPTQFHYWAGARLSETIVVRQNEAVAAHCAHTPSRLFGLGTIALQHPDLAIRQLHEALALGLKGVQVSTRLDSRELSDPTFDPFWRAAEETDAVVFVHPYGCSLGERIAPFYLSNILGQPVETSIALAGLILGGTLARYPALRILAAHGGGYLAAQSGRIDHGWHVRPETRTTPEPPSVYLRQLYFDSLLHAPDELAMLVKKVGSDRVMIGTDYPFDMGAYGPAQLLDQAGLDPAQHLQIAGRNAAQLLHLNEAILCAD